VGDDPLGAAVRRQVQGTLRMGRVPGSPPRPAGLSRRRLCDAPVTQACPACLQEAGAFSIVLEKIPKNLAAEITKILKIPTIGIGAGPYCDGQILVTHDILGLFDKFKPKFARRYTELASYMREAFNQYIKDVKKGDFPSESESYD